MFLDRNSPAYIGGCAEFLLTSDVRENYSRLADAVRRGGVANEKTDTTADNNAIWIEFARAMEGIRRISSEFIADELGSAQSQDPWKVLDIAASHGLFGIAIARKNAKAEITAVDWPAVLELARTNAAKAGVAARYRTIPGDAFKVDLGSGYDIALVTAFLHHFDVPTNEAFLRRIHAALKPGGRVAILEFMPNDDRVSPPPAALFAMTMLVGTPAGDAYTYRELQQMLKNAGFGSSTLHQHPGSPDQVVIATK
jgi:ubiquinone/menaquinone biosynthesis C-methylase UbiE